MKEIKILVSEQVLATSITGPMDMFNIANTLWLRQNREKSMPLFNVELVSADGLPVTTSGGLEIKPNCAISDVEHCDVLLLSAYHFSHKQGLKDFITQLQPTFQHYHRLKSNGALIAGYCSATFGLGASGILNGKNATTSWFFKDYFESIFPSVALSMDKLVIEDQGVWTAGATTSYTDLCLKLIERLSGQEIAMLLAKVMLLDNNRPSQMAFIMPPQLIEHGDNAIASCQEWLQLNYSRDISLDDMSNKTAMSKRNFIRRFKKAVGETPAAYLQKIRVEAAKRLLENTMLPLDKVLDKVGYDDASAFRRVFQKTTSLSPKAYRNRFSQSA